jgi:hypothetical protein
MLPPSAWDSEFELLVHSLSGLGTRALCTCKFHGGIPRAVLLRVVAG